MIKQITVDFILKVCLIISICYLTYFTTEYLKKQSEIGRYQLYNGDAGVVIDTKTGIVYIKEKINFKIERIEK